MAITLRQLTGGTVAFSAWLLSDRTIRVVKLTQAQYDEFAVARLGVGDAPGRPAVDATFLVAAGGIPAIDTADGWPSLEDAWEIDDLEVGRYLEVCTGPLVNFAYRQVIYAPPVNGRSRGTGILARSRGNRQVFLAGQYNRNRLDRIVLTETPVIERVDVEDEIDNHRSVTFDATSSAAINGSSVTFAHVVAAQANAYIAVAGSIVAGQTYSSITYNGDALTSQGEIAGRPRVAYWDLVAPDTGSSLNVVATCSDATAGAFGAWSAYGVDQTTPRADLQTDSGTSTQPFASALSNTDQIVLAIIGWDASDTNTTDVTWAEDWNLEGSGGNARGGGGAHKVGVTPPAETTRTDLLSGADFRWAGIAVALLASTGAPPTFVPFPHPRGMAGGMHRLSGGML